MKLIPLHWFSHASLLMLFASVLFAFVARAADASLVWTQTVSGNWSVAGNWNPNANYPNNGNGGLTYNARGPAGATIVVTLTEPITIQQYTNAGGTLTGDFPLTINELFTWSGGTLSGNAPINALGGASLVTGTKTLTGRTLNLGGGVASWSAGTINSGGGAVLSIEAPAEFNIGFDGGYNLSSGSSSITNRGTFRKSGGTGTTGAGVAAAFHNQPGATVAAASGILSLNGGGNSSGTFNIASGATLSFGGGTHVLDAAAVISGSGTNRIAGGSVSIDGAYDLSAGSTVVSGGTVGFTGSNPRPGNLLLSGSAAVTASFNSGSPVVTLSSLNLTGGTLGGGDPIDVSGGFVWSGGVLSGSGTVQPLSGMTINGSAGRTLNGRTLSLPGGTTNTWLQGTLNSGLGAVLNVDPLALFNIGFDGSYNVAGGGSSVITNRGTIRKTGGTGVATVAPPFNNLSPGVVESASGTLSLNGGGGGDGTYTSGPGSTLRFGGGNHTLAASSKVNGPGTNSVSAGSVVFGGGYDVTGGTLISGGTATFNGSVSSVGTLTLTGTPTATFDTGAAITADSVTLAGGTLGGGDTINVVGGFAWSVGRLDGNGPFNVNGGGAFTGAQAKNLNARTLNLNSGTVTWTVGTINSGGGAVVNNATLFNIGFDGTFNDTLGGASTFNNSGTLRKSAGTGTAIIAPVFNNAEAGRVEVQSGNLSFTGGGGGGGVFDVPAGATLSFGGGAFSLSAGSSIAGAGTNTVTAGSLAMNGTYNVSGGTRVTGGAASFNGPVTAVGALTVSGGTATFASGGDINAPTALVTGGTLSTSDRLNVAGAFNWTAGTLAGAGPINADGPLNISGSSRSLSGQLNVNNGATWNTGNINSGQGAVLTIAPGTLFDTTFDGLLQFTLGGSSTITNRGTFRKSGGISAGGTIVSPIFNNASGATVEVGSGTLSLNGGGNSSGAFAVAGGATLQFGGGSHFLDAASSITGAGTNRVTLGSVTFGGSVGLTGGITVGGGVADFRGTVSGGVPLFVSGGQANFNGASAINFASIALTGGSLGGSNDLTVAGPFTWNGGTLGGSGRLLADGGATFGNNNHTFSGRKLTIPAGRSAAWTAGSFFVDLGATLDIAGLLDNSFDGQYSGGVNGSSLINNSGTIRKSGGNGTTTIGVPLNNNGAIEVNSGRLDLSGGGTGNGSFTVGATRTLGLMAGVFNLGPGASFAGDGTISFAGATVDFTGNYNVTGTSALLGGTLNFKSGTTIQNLGTSRTIAGATVNFDTGSQLVFPTLTVSAGGLGGNDTVSVTNLFIWSGGSLAGAGQFNAFGGVELSGNSRNLSGRHLTLAGTSTWSAGSIGMDSGAVFYIGPGATLLNSFDGTIGGVIGSGGITNAGTFRKTGGTGSTLFVSRLDNLGAVEINSGVLDFSFAVYSQAAGTTVLNGGNLTGEIELLGGTLNGAGTLAGFVTNAATLNPGAPIGVLTINGEFSQGPTGVLNIDLGGTAAGTSYDQVVVTTGNAAFLGGSLNIHLTNGFLPSIGDTFRVMNFDFHNGDFATYSGLDLGVTDRHLEAVFDTTGLILVTKAGPLAAFPNLSYQFLPPSTLELSWLNSFSDFHLESTTNLVTPNWKAFGTPGTNAVTVIVDSTEPQRYFRLTKP